MRQICNSIETRVRDSRGLSEIQEIREQIKTEFAEFNTQADEAAEPSEAEIVAEEEEGLLQDDE